MQCCLHPASYLGAVPCLLCPPWPLTLLSAAPSTVFSQTPILQALQHVQASCDEAHKMK